MMVGREPSAGDVLAARLGLVTAPAGCGKTDLIVKAVKQHRGKPVLVLTHTNAGVAALRARFKKAAVPASSYRLATIDGWCLRLVSMFPIRADYKIDRAAKIDYTAVRTIAKRVMLLVGQSDLVQATYGRLLVDEYQDCSVEQHALVLRLSEILPACVFGDPLQAIFNFRGNSLVTWDDDVEATFPVIGALETPWRWRNAGAEDLGKWILDVRRRMIAGRPVDFRVNCERVRWVRLTGNPGMDLQAQIQEAGKLCRVSSEQVMVLTDASNASGRHDFARRLGVGSVVEPVELPEFLSHLEEMNGKTGEALAAQLLMCGRAVMTGLDVEGFKKRIAVLRRGSAKKAASPEEFIGIRLMDGGSIPEAIALLDAFRRNPAHHVFRPSLLSAITEAMRVTITSKNKDLISAGLAVRERRRHAGRPVPNRGIGSTLLLKGLEADHVLILNADNMNSANLYVALSRATKSVTVFSASSVVKTITR